MEQLTFSSTSPDCSFAFSDACVTSLTRGDVNDRFTDRAQKVVIYTAFQFLLVFARCLATSSDLHLAPRVLDSSD